MIFVGNLIIRRVVIMAMATPHSRRAVIYQARPTRQYREWFSSLSVQRQ